MKVKLVKKQVLREDLFKFSVESAEIAEAAKPGQFLEIRVSDNIDPFLRRPISIYNIDKENRIVEFIFQIRGKGTKILSEKKEGDLIDILGPLGYGTFEIKENKKTMVIGGGIGIFPLYELAKQLQDKGNNTTVYLGFRNKNFVCLEEEFKNKANKLVVTTDDGSYENPGFAIEYMKKDISENKPDIIYACGPLPMLKAVRELSIRENIPCQISLEERMGCGIGACLGCAVKVISGESPRYGHVCKEGPVFFANEVEI